MPEIALSPGGPERLRVFVSSTIGECAAERAAARRAILGLNFTPVQFEQEGARAEPPRSFYMRKLNDSHVVVAIYRNSYGWVDSAKGMSISGLEDEYRETLRIGRPMLGYVLRPDSARAPRLRDIVTELMAGPNVVYLFEDGEDLEARIRDDLTNLVTERFTRLQASSPASQSAACVLRSIFRLDALRIRRVGLLDEVTQAASLSRLLWVVGEAGAGKTALMAEWADERSAPYVTARGLDPRSVLIAAARELGAIDEAKLSAPLFDDARSLLLSQWPHGRRWPLVLDDVGDLDAVWPVISACLATTGGGSVVLVARDPDGAWPGARLAVRGFTAPELDALRDVAGIRSTVETGDLPITLRAAASAGGMAGRYAGLPPVLRETLGYVALSPTPLSLADLQTLLGPSAGSAVGVADMLDGVGDLVVSLSFGYDFVHERIKDVVAGEVGRHPQLRALLLDRLTDRLATTNRAWEAFTVHCRDDAALGERLADMSVREAVFTGSSRRLLAPLEFLADLYRARGERSRLLSVLLSLADILAGRDDFQRMSDLLGEASAVADRLDDDARAEVSLLRVSLALRGSASQAALLDLRALQREARASRRTRDLARLLLEEGIALLGVNAMDRAILVLREARSCFETVGDTFGVEVTTRNLILSLALTTGAEAESERLRSTLIGMDQQSPRHRAWSCNLLAARLRREGRHADAEARAREAIALGEELGDDYVVAVNNIALGNVLREVDRLTEAAEAYSSASRIARTIRRTDIESRGSRLLASIENEQASLASGTERREHAGRAERHATHAALLLAESFASHERALALEERGDARSLLDRPGDALTDYADAAAIHLDAGDEAQAARTIELLVTRCDDHPDVGAVMVRALAGPGRGEVHASMAWVQAVTAVLDRCPIAVVPAALGALVRGFMPGEEGSFWLHCLVRCLLEVGRTRGDDEARPLEPMLLIAILAFGRHRDPSGQDLLTLAGLCLSSSPLATVRHRRGRDLAIVILTGRRRDVLVTIRTEAKRREEIFVAIFVASFLAAYGDDLTDILFGGGLLDGVAVDVAVLARANRKDLDGIALDGPVTVGRLTRDGAEKPPILLLVADGAAGRLKGDVRRGGEVEVMLGRLVQEILHATLGKTLDDETYSSKVRDLLVGTLR